MDSDGERKRSPTTATSFDFENRGLLEVLLYGLDDVLARLGVIRFAQVTQETQVLLLVLGDALLRYLGLELGKIRRRLVHSSHACVRKSQVFRQKDLRSHRRFWITSIAAPQMLWMALERKRHQVPGARGPLRGDER